MERYDVVVVGASAAGFSAATAVAESDPRLSILLVGDEDRLPYKRTKISKNIAAGFGRDEFALSHDLFSRRRRSDDSSGGSPPGAGSGSALTYRSRTRAIAIDREANRVALQEIGDKDTGAKETGPKETGLSDRTSEVEYRRLILATGSRPRETWTPARADDRAVSGNAVALPGAHLAYSATQVEALREAAITARSALVLGLGVLGVEVAEQLSRMGLTVELAGRSTGVMTRELNDHTSQRLRDLLESQGITVVPKAEPVHVVASQEKSALGESESPRGGGAPRGGVVVDFADGRSRRYDLLVATLGIDRNIELASAARLDVDVGVLVEPTLSTSAPSVFACGDCVEFRDGGMNHLWRHGEQQGTTAGKNVVASLKGDVPTAYHRLPFRLKCAVFDDYFYSINRPSPAELAKGAVAGHVFRPRPDDRFPARRGDAYVKAFYRGNELTGIIMAGDSDNQKAYTRAVHEHYSLERLADELILR